MKENNLIKEITSIPYLFVKKENNLLILDFKYKYLKEYLNDYGFHDIILIKNDNEIDTDNIIENEGEYYFEIMRHATTLMFNILQNIYKGNTFQKMENYFLEEDDLFIYSFKFDLNII